MADLLEEVISALNARGMCAKEVARVMSVRRLSASQRPQTARPIGGSLRAPFRDWLEAIGAASTPKRHRGAPCTSPATNAPPP